MFFVAALAAICICSSSFEAATFEKVKRSDLIKIVKAEDELRFDKILLKFLDRGNEPTRVRAALAAGRIGDEKAIPSLIRIMATDTAPVAQMAAFAIGEIESADGSAAILSALQNSKISSPLRARVIEAAGKLVAADRKSEYAEKLGKAILKNLANESAKESGQNREVVLLGITALIRARPDDGDVVLSGFLSNGDARIRSDALNAMARLRSKTAIPRLKSILMSDPNPVARANAARAIGAAEDKESVTHLLRAALTDDDSRVRVGAIGALGRIKEEGVGPKLLDRAENLFSEYRKSKFKEPVEINEILAIGTALGSILESTKDPRSISFLSALRKERGLRDGAIEIALLRISPSSYADVRLADGHNWQAVSAIAQAFGTAADLKESKDEDALKAVARVGLQAHLMTIQSTKAKTDLSYPAILRAYAKYKAPDLGSFLSDALKHDDPVVRGNAAGLIGSLDIDKKDPLGNWKLLQNAYLRSESDVMTEGAMGALSGLKDQYAILMKYVKARQVETGKEIVSDLSEPFRKASNSPDYLVRRRAHTIAKDLGLKLEPASDRISFDEKGVSRVKRANYRRAVKRKKASAVLTTEKGAFTIVFFPEAAPLTVENFVTLAKSGYFNGLAIHRVVPNFVVQDGDPRGDGEGGPGWQIRCEINQLSYERGSVGMALAGKDTGGSQWFVAHSPQPHLDGGYTVFGKVNEDGMKIVDMLVRGDVIEKVEISE
jgi:cyclophilin family peptidyl-prolyl cis-trans isomerase/HEAT repeat protein